MTYLHLRTRLLATYLAAGVLPVLVIGAVIYFIASNAFEGEIASKLSAFENTINQMVEARRTYAAGVGRQIASNAALGEALQVGDAERLRAVCSEILAEDDMLDYLTVAAPDGTVLARGHSEAAGDSIASQKGFQQAINGAGGVFIEDGNLVKLALRGGFPVYNKGALVGVASSGMSLASNDFVDEVKSTIGVECSIFGGPGADKRVATTVIENGERALGSRMENPEVIEKVLQRGEIFRDVNIVLGTPMDTAYWPIRNHSGDAVGMFAYGVPREITAAAQNRIFWTTAGAVALVVLVLAPLAWLIAQGVCGPITRAISMLTDSSTQVSAASEQISGACNTLAEASTEQASSLEESSAALEELTSQAEGNADSARQAAALMQEMREAARQAGVDMDEMVQSMSRIRSSSDKMSGIIKTIEEVAFQTNLLALNAAVEAARAGDHGKGFAVVAEEVRNLAQRAGQAARDTSELIEESVNESAGGAQVVERAAEGIRKTLKRAESVTASVVDVETASSEQSHGIQQINSAVSQMDQVTQQVAAGSEEAAASASELNAQSQHMIEVVGMLADVVERRKGSGSELQGAGAWEEPSGPQALRPEHAGHEAPARGTSAAANGSSARALTKGRANGNGAGERALEHSRWSD